MTILWSFSYNFFVKFHVKKMWATIPVLYQNMFYNEVCYKGSALYMYINCSWNAVFLGLVDTVLTIQYLLALLSMDYSQFAVVISQYPSYGHFCMFLAHLSHMLNASYCDCWMCIVCHALWTIASKDIS